MLAARGACVRQPNRSVAVVDDDAGVRRALERLLRAAGYEPLVFRSAEEFLEGGARERAACLVLDIHLGGMSGLELRKRLAAEGSQLPVLFITAHDDKWCREATRLTGSLGILHKPFDGHGFLDAVGRAIQEAPRVGP